MPGNGTTQVAKPSPTKFIQRTSMIESPLNVVPSLCHRKMRADPFASCLAVALAYLLQLRKTFPQSAQVACKG